MLEKGKLLIVSMFMFGMANCAIAQVGPTATSQPRTVPISNTSEFGEGVIIFSWPSISGPEFPHGAQALYKFRENETQYPDSIEGEGRVIVSFTVGKEVHLIHYLVGNSAVVHWRSTALLTILLGGASLFVDRNA